MSPPAPASGSVDAYIARFPPEVQELLREIRATIREIVPQATEKIAYGVPTFVLHGNLVHFGGFAGHVSLYPAPRKNERFQEALSAYRGGTGTVQFPLDRPLPLDLIRDIVRFLVEQNEAMAAARGERKAARGVRKPRPG